MKELQEENSSLHVIKTKQQDELQKTKRSLLQLRQKVRKLKNNNSK